MTRNEIQDVRMRRYFIDAAKELIKGEGVVVVSTRNVAERSGYSYATIYNYFKDVRDLIFACVEDFQQECKEYIESQVKGIKGAKKNISSITNSYIKFFCMYPGIFELFFLEKPKVISTRKSSIESIYTFFDDMLDESWQSFASEKKISPLRLETIKQAYKLAVHGELLFFINRRNNETLESVTKRIDGILNYFIKR
ncbi:MAG: TetR/AcrR family transcriptional regulator [Bacteroidetes bacterium]|nr:TetR/AcrR family transcriptional regulator [Bacteroidota bacterium]